MTPNRVEAQRTAVALDWAARQARAPIVVTCAEAAPRFAQAGAPPPVGHDGVIAQGSWCEMRLDRCVDRVDPAFLVDLAIASGGEVLVEGCQQADARALGRLADLTMGRVRIGPLEAGAVVGAGMDMAHPPVSRRGLVQAGDLITPVAHLAEDAEGRLVESLRILLPGDADLPGAAAGLALAVSGCTACGVCVRACPHEALDLITRQHQSLLVHQPDRCRGERDCVQSCPVDAIAVTGPMPWQPVLAGRPLPLARLVTRDCGRCGATIPRGATMCEPCQRRTSNPFGWHVPEPVRDAMAQRWRDRFDG